MTKKHFEAIAKIIRERLEWADPVQTGYIDGVARTAQELADYFKAENPRFDRQRFLTACGL